MNGDEQFSKAYSRIYVPYDAVLKGFYDGDDRIIPVIPNITKGWHDHNIRENFDKLMEVSAQNGIAIGNLGWIEPFAMDFHGVIPEVAVSGKIPVITSEHCLFAPSPAWLGKTDSSERSESEAGGRCIASDRNFCGKRCEQTNIFLKDRKGQFYPILTNPADCRSIILSYRETNLIAQKDVLKNAGVSRFRIYAE